MGVAQMRDGQSQLRMVTGFVVDLDLERIEVEIAGNGKETLLVLEPQA